jgi:aminoglycoside phosphotransferase (APT) family kinase protein
MASRAGDVIPAPKNVDEITAAWMTIALQVEYPRVEVTHLHHGQVRHGSESTVRVLLNYNRWGHEARLPASMYVKGQWTPRALERGYVGASSEGRFYQDIAPLIPNVNVPACYFATVRPDGSAVVMEDLFARNVVLGSAGDSFKPETAYQLADQLAQLHALRLDSSELHGIDWLMRSSSDSAMDLERMAEEETGIFGSFKEWWWEKRTHFDYNGFLPPELLDRRIVKRALVNKYALEDQQAKSVVHGDPHLGNMFFDLDGRPGLYDWSTGIGRWGNDLNYAIVGSLEVEDRREHEQPILRHYLDRLATYGGPRIPWDEAWLSWRRQTIHGFMYMLCSPRQQPEDLIRVQTIRFGWDAIDNDMLNALAV